MAISRQGVFSTKIWPRREIALDDLGNRNFKSIGTLSTGGGKHHEYTVIIGTGTRGKKGGCVLVGFGLLLHPTGAFGLGQCETDLVKDLGRYVSRLFELRDVGLAHAHSDRQFFLGPLRFDPGGFGGIGGVAGHVEGDEFAFDRIGEHALGFGGQDQVLAKY